MKLGAALTLLALAVAGFGLHEVKAVRAAAPVSAPPPRLTAPGPEHRHARTRPPPPATTAPPFGLVPAADDDDPPIVDVAERCPGVPYAADDGCPDPFTD